MSLKNAIKSVIPESLLRWRNNAIGTRRQREYGNKSVAEAFSEIYAQNLWGGEAGEFYSGTGSEAFYAPPYAEMVKKLIAENDIKTVVDLGCGDFRIASKFVS